MKSYFLVINTVFVVECRTPGDKADHRLRSYSHVMPRVLASFARKLVDRFWVIVFGHWGCSNDADDDIEAQPSLSHAFLVHENEEEGPEDGLGLQATHA